MAAAGTAGQHFLFVGGTSCFRAALPVSGRHFLFLGGVGQTEPELLLDSFLLLNMPVSSVCEAGTEPISGSGAGSSRSHALSRAQRRR